MVRRNAERQQLTSDDNEDDDNRGVGVPRPPRDTQSRLPVSNAQIAALSALIGVFVILLSNSWRLSPWPQIMSPQSSSIILVDGRQISYECTGGDAFIMSSDCAESADRTSRAVIAEWKDSALFQLWQRVDPIRINRQPFTCANCALEPVEWNRAAQDAASRYIVQHQVLSLDAHGQSAKTLDQLCSHRKFLIVSESRTGYLSRHNLMSMIIATSLHGERIIISYESLRAEIEWRIHAVETNSSRSHLPLTTTSLPLSLCQSWLIDSAHVDTLDKLQTLRQSNSLLAWFGYKSNNNTDYRLYDNAKQPFYHFLAQWDRLEQLLEAMAGDKPTQMIMFLGSWAYATFCGEQRRKDFGIIQRSSLYKKLTGQTFHSLSSSSSSSTSSLASTAMLIHTEHTYAHTLTISSIIHRNTTYCNNWYIQHYTTIISLKSPTYSYTLIPFDCIETHIRLNADVSQAVMFHQFLYHMVQSITFRPNSQTFTLSNQILQAINEKLPLVQSILPYNNEINNEKNSNINNNNNNNKLILLNNVQSPTSQFDSSSFYLPLVTMHMMRSDTCNGDSYCQEHMNQFRPLPVYTAVLVEKENQLKLSSSKEAAAAAAAAELGSGAASVPIYSLLELITTDQGLLSGSAQWQNSPSSDPDFDDPPFTISRMISSVMSRCQSIPNLCRTIWLDNLGVSTYARRILLRNMYAPSVPQCDPMNVVNDPKFVRNVTVSAAEQVQCLFARLYLHSHFVPLIITPSDTHLGHLMTAIICVKHKQIPCPRVTLIDYL